MRREVEIDGLTRGLAEKDAELETLKEKLQNILGETRKFRFAHIRRAIIRTIAQIALQEDEKKQAIWALHHKVRTPSGAHHTMGGGCEVVSF